MFQKTKSADKLSVIIVGAGKVGATLVEQLSAEGCDVTVVDKNPEVVHDLTSKFDVLGVVGNGASYTVQQEAGIEKTDLFIAVTDSDELNILCCVLAKRASNASTVARVRTPEYVNELSYIRSQLGLTMIINPDLEAAKEASRIISMPSALEVMQFAHGLAEMIRVKIPEGSILHGKKLCELGVKLTSDIVICAVERNDNIYIPSGSFTLMAGDTISFASARDKARSFMHTLGYEHTKIHNVMIVGGSKASFYLAKRLIQANMDVKIIEIDRKVCEYLTEKLPKVVMINGDGTNAELLKEEGLDHMDAFVSMTGMDEENVLMTLHARKVSTAKVITKIKREAFRDVISEMNLGSVIYPRYIVSEAIIAFARAMRNSVGLDHIQSLNHMFDQRVEAIEFLVEEESEVTNVMLKDLRLKNELLVALINRHGKIIFPSGQDMILKDDTVVIVTTHKGFTTLNDIVQ